MKMSEKLAFKQVIENNLERLEQFVPIVDRVHGEHHPEFHEVHRLFNEINAKIKATASNKPELNEEFTNLREITNNYTIPDDVCESYEAVYRMLEEMDSAYQDG
jgi:iron-sulfur cluster repair protein YtfE (RIC family)